MKNLEFLKYLHDQEDAAYERIKLGHFDENGAAYYRGKHDQAFAMRRDLEERLQHDAATVSNIVDIWTEEIMRWRKWTPWPRRRENLLALCDTLKSLK